MDKQPSTMNNATPAEKVPPRKVRRALRAIARRIKRKEVATKIKLKKATDAAMADPTTY